MLDIKEHFKVEFKYLQCSTNNGISHIRMNKPETMNALNEDLLDELGAAFSEYGGDHHTRVIIVSSSHEGYFISGGDIKYISGFPDAVGARDGILYIQNLFNRIENLEKPVIAAISGVCLGGGCELAMSCHIRIAAETAKFGQPEVKIGLIPGAGGTQRLARLVGKGMATEMVLTGDMINAQQALRIGLVNHVVKGDSLIPTAKDIAKKIAFNAPLATRYALKAIGRSDEGTLNDGLTMERDSFALLCTTADMREGVNAFKEKRRPVFTGK
ncbi:MAG: enoyl-CoA hydratase/isomerase family protein [Deltaproteobacteria bacterium]|nr:enoyl-CoA hydratase/isomerase family protein [Deltaproteobacteria bacterium]